MNKDKMYVVMSEDNSLSLQTRAEVDSWIKNAEEGSGSLSYSVVGSITLGAPFNYYLLSIKMGTSIVYDIVGALDAEAAKDFSSKRPRFKKGITIMRIQDLSHLIAKHYE